MTTRSISGMSLSEADLRTLSWIGPKVNRSNGLVGSAAYCCHMDVEPRGNMDGKEPKLRKKRIVSPVPKIEPTICFENLPNSAVSFISPERMAETDFGTPNKAPARLTQLSRWSSIHLVPMLNMAHWRKCWTTNPPMLWLTITTLRFLFLALSCSILCRISLYTPNRVSKSGRLSRQSYERKCIFLGSYPTSFRFSNTFAQTQYPGNK
mmetsp:Transcript_5791/g.10412  ORF Transcript_5791/g.10412 Transcript_5791/m.10412 type:complete len:208 (+) Transcript_5791:175-798(+)